MFINHCYHFFPIYIYIQNNVTHMDRKMQARRWAPGGRAHGAISLWADHCRGLVRCTLGGRQGEGEGVGGLQTFGTWNVTSLVGKESVQN